MSGRRESRGSEGPWGRSLRCCAFSRIMRQMVVFVVAVFLCPRLSYLRELADSDVAASTRLVCHASALGQQDDFNAAIAEIINNGIVFTPAKFDFDEAYEAAKTVSQTPVIWDVYHVDEKLLVQKLEESMERFILNAYLALRRKEPDLRAVPIVGNARLMHFLRSLLTRNRVKTTKSDSELSNIFRERPRLFEWIPDLPVQVSETHDEL
uniref:Uncharacterized protein n=1 Tax=Toxoplasma gondii (strain ATCC 50861 / VEG) TaxID=432359 RepID=A0A0F7VG79_TOXGV|nr:TPA: hypothetical protein BN1205_027613 [Toxoplasma gondii VEG]